MFDHSVFWRNTRAIGQLSSRSDVSFYSLLMVPFVLIIFEGLLPFRFFSGVKLTRFIPTELVQKNTFVWLAFGLLLIGLNTTTSSFNFDGTGMATMLLGAILFDFCTGRSARWRPSC